MGTPSPSLRDAIYDQLARLTRALAHPKRLQAIELLAQAPRTVEVLARQLGLSVAGMSQHLQTLKQARLVESSKQGLYVTYRLADDTVYDLVHALYVVGESRLAEIEQITRQAREGRDLPGPADYQELAPLLASGEAVVVDVRLAEEYLAGHLPGAWSLPMAQLEERLAELPREPLVVVHCRGMFCFMAMQAVEVLRRHGFRAIYLEEGVRDMAAAGVEMETG